MTHKTSNIISVIKTENILFLEPDRHGGWKTLYTLPIAQLLDENAAENPIPKGLRQKTNTLMVVPDFWMGNISYQFQSKKRTLAEAYISRKLSTDFPDLSQVRHFFDYTFEKTPNEDQDLYVYFLQESGFFYLYERLESFGLNPLHIVTPAYLWEEALKNVSSDFQKGGKALIHLCESECFLYFFSDGRFLFSRSIVIPDSQKTSAQIFELLSYEIDQSVYLFSQKARADIAKFFLISSRIINTADLSKTLGKEVEDIDIKNATGMLGPIEFFNTADLFSPKGYLNISHRQLKEELKWKPVQIMGIAVGLAVICWLLLEAVFLWDWSRNENVLVQSSSTIPASEQAQMIEKYNTALDLILADYARPSPSETIELVAASLNDNIQIREMTIASEEAPGIDIKGVVTATGPYDFRESVSEFLDNLNHYVKGTRILNMQDVDFKIDEKSIGQTHQNYLINLRIDLT